MVRLHRFRQWLPSRSASVTVVVLCAAVAGCAPRVARHGDAIDPARLQEITPGTSTQQDVVQLLGSPSSVAPLERKQWYYIASRTETWAFLKPKVVERQVVVISFDDTGVVQSIAALDKDAGREVQLVERETPTMGNRFTFMEQMLGNIGRFEKK